MPEIMLSSPSSYELPSRMTQARPAGRIRSRPPLRRRCHRNAHARKKRATGLIPLMRTGRDEKSPRLEIRSGRFGIAGNSCRRNDTGSRPAP
jgi:hypothetical protein